MSIDERNWQDIFQEMLESPEKAFGEGVARDGTTEDMAGLLLLTRQLQELGKRPVPDADAALSRARERVLMSLPAPEPASLAAPTTPPFWRRWQSMLAPAFQSIPTAFIAAVLIALLAIAAIQFSSRSQPGSPLFPVKMASEKVMQLLAPSEQPTHYAKTKEQRPETEQIAKENNQPVILLPTNESISSPTPAHVATAPASPAPATAEVVTPQMAKAPVASATMPIAAGALFGETPASKATMTTFPVAVSSPSPATVIVSHKKRPAATKKATTKKKKPTKAPRKKPAPKTPQKPRRRKTTPIPTSTPDHSGMRITGRNTPMPRNAKTIAGVIRWVKRNPRRININGKTIFLNRNTRIKGKLAAGRKAVARIYKKGKRWYASSIVVTGAAKAKSSEKKKTPTPATRKKPKATSTPRPRNAPVRRPTSTPAG